MFPLPGQYAEHTVYDLLKAASQGHIGLDHRLLRAIAARGDAAVPDLLRLGAELSDEDRVHLDTVLIDLFRHLKSAEALPYFLEFIRRFPDEAAEHLAEVMRPIGAAAVEPLLALYEELGEEEASDVAFLLASLGVRDRRILSVLTERLEYDLGDAALCLGLYGDPAAVPALEKMLAQLKAEEGELRCELESTIAQIRQALPAFEAEEFDLLAQYPETEGPQTDLLDQEERLAMLDSPSAEYRELAAHGFFNTELSTSARDRLFLAARNDPDTAVRARAWETLAGSIDEPEIRKTIAAVLTNPDAPVDERAGAAVGLHDALDDPAVRDSVIALYNLGGRPRAKALEAMWRSLDRSFAGYFPQHLDDPSSAIRRQAIFGVGYLGVGSHADRLRRFFEHEDWRSDALFAYALCVPGEISRSRIRAVYRKIEDAAGSLTGTEEELVKIALDDRLALHGYEAVFAAEADAHPHEHDREHNHQHDHEHDHDHHDEPATGIPKVGRNDPCPCGSGKKYKKCHGATA